MFDDHEKTFKKDVIERLGKAKGRLRQSFPEIQQLIKTSNVVEAARKLIGPAHSIFQQFAEDVQLKDLLAKAEAIVVKANLTVAKTGSKDSSPAETFQNETSANVFPSKGGFKERAIEATASEEAAEEDAVEEEGSAAVKAE
jgi:hypothetical protein